jgi:quaternary ammonium compound-resistance protein SugE
MPWIWLLVAAAFEVGWAIGLKYTAGFTKLGPTVLTVAAMLVSFYCLAQAVRPLPQGEIPIGTGYAIWTGIGAVGTAALGILLFSEPTTWPRLASIALIVLGVVGLKLTH